MNKTSAIIFGVLTGGVFAALIAIIGAILHMKTAPLAGGVGGGIGALLAIKLMKKSRKVKYE